MITKSPFISTGTEVETGRPRVLLAVDSTQYAQLISNCAADQAPDLDLMYFTDEQGRALDSIDPLDLLITIADSEPDIVVHATQESEPNANNYGWIFDQFPFVEIVHVNPEGRIRRIRQSVLVAEFDNQVRERGGADGVGRLFAAIRSCTPGRRFDVLSAPPWQQRTGDYVKP
jgi:hypothetical protein